MPGAHHQALASGAPLRLTRHGAHAVADLPEPASAGASAVPMTPKQALCSAETAQIRGTLRLGGVLGVGGGIVASGGGFGPGFSLLGASGPMVEACLLARLRRRPGVAGKANAVAVCSRA